MIDENTNPNILMNKTQTNINIPKNINIDEDVEMKIGSIVLYLYLKYL